MQSKFPDQFVAKKKRRNKRDKLEIVRYRPTIVLNPQLNGSLKKDLEQGRIGGFKLTRGSTEFKGEADEPAVQRLDVQLQVRIAPTNDFPRVKRLLDHVRQTLSTISFEALNIELVDDSGSPIENTKSIDIGSLEENNLRYCKIISMPDTIRNIEEVCGSLDEDITCFIIKCISNDSLW